MDENLSSNEADENFDFVLVERSQLNLLLQHCHRCGKVTGEVEKKKLISIRRLKQRKVEWTRAGSCMTAGYALFRAVKIPFMSQRAFLCIQEHYAKPVVREMYEEMQTYLLSVIESP
uniref:Uncharacterized protein n=1 Tax=Ditylenchus dipsaci TaxID=166011 RepID=A0A915DFY3_9BILA